MKKLMLILTLAFVAVSLSLAQQVIIGWHQSSIEVDAGVSDQKIFVVLRNTYTDKGVWSFQIDITSANVTLTTGSVDLYPNLSTNFYISKTNIANGVRVIVYGKTTTRMFQPNFNSSVLVVTLPTLSAGSYSVTLSNASAVIRDYPSGANPQSVTPTLSPATINITASTPTPPPTSPTHTAGGYTNRPRKYGDINWDNAINIVDVTGLADVLIGNYSAVSVSDPVYGNRNFFTDPTPNDGYDAVLNDRTTADVNGGNGTLDLMDIATLEDAVLSSVWPSYAISAIAGQPAFKVNDKGIGTGVVLARFSDGSSKINANANGSLKFEVFNPGGKTSKIRVKLENNEPLLRGLQIEFVSSVLPGRIDVWKMPDANGLTVNWKRNEFNEIVIVVYADGGKYIKVGESVLLTIVVPNVTVEQLLSALRAKPIASVGNTAADLAYSIYEFGGEVPLDYMLYQNYPNPFNPGTEIRFDIPEYSNVKIIVWNVLGQKIRTLVEANLDPGRKSVKWDGRDEEGNLVGSGVYFYTMYAKSLEDGREFTMTRKAVLMK